MSNTGEDPFFKAFLEASRNAHHSLGLDETPSLQEMWLLMIAELSSSADVLSAFDHSAKEMSPCVKNAFCKGLCKDIGTEAMGVCRCMHPRHLQNFTVENM